MSQRARVIALLLVAALLVGSVAAYARTGAPPRVAQQGGTPAEASPSPSPSTTPPGQEDVAPPTQRELVTCIAGGQDVLGLAGSEPVRADDAAGQVVEITDRIEALRGLPQREELAPEFVSGREIARRAAAATLEDYPPEEADLDRRLLAALGAIPPDLDLRTALTDLVSGSIAGYYDTETEELVVLSGDPDAALGPAEQSTLAHEVEHALADQAFELDAADDLTGDEATAYVALVEGDATLTGQRFALRAFDPEQQQSLAVDPEVAESQSQLGEAPHVLSAALLFSYSEGLNFVCDLWAEGGFAAVDAAYRNPPATSAEILFPQRYPAAAVPPRPPTAPGAGWTEARSQTLGAADLLWLFEAPGDDRRAALDDPRLRAADWAGGRVTLWTQGTGTAVGLALVGGGGGAGPALCDSMTAWLTAAYPDAAEARVDGAAAARDGIAQDVVLACAGDEVRLGVAPDLATAGALTG